MSSLCPPRILSILSVAPLFAFLTLIHPASSHAAPGELDTTFGSTTRGPNGVVYATALQPDGKVIIAGGFTLVDGTARQNISRLNSDGTLDATFGDTTGGPDGVVYAVAIQPDGKIVIAGEFITVDGSTRRRIARLKSDGTLDASFVSTTGTSDTKVTCLELQADGKIIMGGTFASVGGITRNNIARLNVDGTLDTTFGTTTSGPSSVVNSVMIQADGKVVIVGNFGTVDGITRSNIARLEADGTLDTTYGTTTGGPDGPVNSGTLQPDGKVVIGGSFANVDGTDRANIARLSTGGTLDPTFGSTTGGPDDRVNCVTSETSGKLVISGSFSAVDGTAREHVARLNTDGTLDTTFGTPTSGPNSTTYGVSLQADGKAIVGGFYFMVDGIDRDHVARLQSTATSGSLSNPSLSKIQWLRGGTAPEANYVTFETSTNGGATWASLGNGVRISGGWEITGVNITGGDLIRARAYTKGGFRNASGGIVEATATATTPEIPGGGGGASPKLKDTWTAWYNLASYYYGLYASFGDYNSAFAFYSYYFGVGDYYYHLARKNQGPADFALYNGLALFYLYAYSSTSSYYYYLALAYYYYFLGFGDFDNAIAYYYAFIAFAS